MCLTHGQAMAWGPMSGLASARVLQNPPLEIHGGLLSWTTNAWLPILEMKIDGTNILLIPIDDIMKLLGFILQWHGCNLILTYIYIYINSHTHTYIYICILYNIYIYIIYIYISLASLAQWCSSSLTPFTVLMTQDPRLCEAVLCFQHLQDVLPCHLDTVNHGVHRVHPGY